MHDRTSSLGQRLHQAAFDALYRRSLIYNACWEDPALDRVALGLKPGHDVLVITSGGCNALDYALCAPNRVVAVDANPRQNAVLELKIAGIRELDFDDFFRLFGHGVHPYRRELYRRRLRPQLSEFAQGWWDERINWFAGEGWRDSFYYRGLAGLAARLMRARIDANGKLRQAVCDLLAARSLEEQREIYDRHVEQALWTGSVRWVLGRQVTMNLLGVPTAQAGEVQRANAGGIAGFIRDAITYVFRELPVWTNYFWSVYLRGSYDRSCCPEYLKPENFAALKHGLVDRVVTECDTVAGLLRRGDRSFDRYVLLDHMDWMGIHRPQELGEEWQLLLDHARPGARAIWRSAHQEQSYLPGIRLPGGGAVLDRLAFDRPLAAQLHRNDRVGTYGGFHIADLRAA